MNLAGNTDQKQIFSGLMWGQISRLGEIGLSFLTSILIVRLLGKQEYGNYSTALSLIMLTATIIGFGLSETLSRYLPEARTASPPYQFGLLRQSLFIRLISSLLGGLVLFFIAPLQLNNSGSLSGQQTGLLLLGFTVIYSLNELLGSYFIALLDLKFYFWVRFLTQLGSFFLTLALFWLIGPTALLALLMLAGTLLVQGLLYLLKLGFSAFYKATAVPRVKVGQTYRYARDVWIISLFTYALGGQFDIIVLAMVLRDPAQVAYYTLITLVMSRLQTLVTGWTTSNLSTFAIIHNEQGLEGVNRYYNYYYKLSLLTMLTSTGWVVGVSLTLIPLLFGKDFSPALPVLWVYSLHLVISVSLGSIITNQVLLALGRQNRVLYWRLAFSLVNIVLDLIFIPLFGALGAILASGLANSSLHLIELFIIKDLLKNFPWAFLGKLLAALVLAVLAGFAGVLWVDSALPGLLVGSGIYLIVLLGVLLVLKPFEAADLRLAARLKPGLANKLRYLSRS